MFYIYSIINKNPKVFAHDREKQKAEVTMAITVFFLFTWRVRSAARGPRSCSGLWRRKAAVREQRGPGHRSPKDYSACWYGIPVLHLLHNAWWSPSRTRGCRTGECRVPQGGGGSKKQHQLWKRGGQAQTQVQFHSESAVHIPPPSHPITSLGGSEG